MKTLQLFNAVIAKESNEKAFVSDLGIVIEPNAVWAKNQILNFYAKEKLSSEALNSTFHKSWSKIKKSSRFELLLDQIKHYFSTYGSNFQDEMYIPNEVLEVPENKLTFKIIKAYSKEELTKKALELLQSGIALKEETIDDLLFVLTKELNYQFMGDETVKNKEAVVKIADLFEIYPKNPTEFLRYIVFKATDSTLLIKNNEVLEAIKSTKYNPTKAFETFGLEKLATIFNRFKPIFLAFKDKNPTIINKISKLSKTLHQPLISNPLNDVTNSLLSENEKHWLDNATPFALFKALSACYSRMNGQNAFVYRIRNGKSWVKKNKSKDEVWSNYYFILEYMKTRFNLSGKRIFIPKDIDYALPTSEKMFVGNIPTGTRFYAKKMAVGIYWENKWGANDLDLSGLNIGGKIGWNAQYNQNEGNLMYSGDITDAPNGATEYLYANRGLSFPTLVICNVFGGSSEAGYKIVIGKGDEIDYNYMMNPNNLLLEAKCTSVQRQNILGILIPNDATQCFVILNFGAGHSHVSGNSEISTLATQALYQQWSNPLIFNELIVELGAVLVDKKEDSDFDFSLNKLEKDSFTKIFYK
ncbi:hypothetical protein [Epilithonimonas hungarica]|uniref:Uncharacterized protein n=1 Tax=Epilithonimonas hungarica TaxID=454006 RepID=A0A1G7U6U3_9FLAO|nr:hypothetical protein [Epilithonimonas hungarica]SDG43385.1 hypothetical protein SAMN05421825_3344 [Epilithonimonas hungarica]